MEFFKEQDMATKNRETKTYELQCYITLAKIKHVLEDDTLTDRDCFQRIEEIVSIYEEMGDKIRFRHDF